MALIKDIDRLKEFVKISASTPFDIIKPFLADACDIYLVRYLGQTLVDHLDESNLTGAYSKLYEKASKAEGILALWIGNSELSVQVSNTGFTVARTTELAPASDTKIAEVKESLCNRAFQQLDLVLEFLELNAVTLTEWQLSNYYQSRNKSYIKSARMFQDEGKVNIEYSRLRFENMRSIMQQLEDRYIVKLIGSALDDELRPLETSPDAAKNKMLQYIRKFIANKTAELYTSESSLSKPKTNDIRPVYFDIVATGNFYAEQAVFYYNELLTAYNDYLTSIGQTPTNGALEVNEDLSGLFVANG